MTNIAPFLIWLLGMCLMALPIGFFADDSDEIFFGLFMAILWPISVPFACLMFVGHLVREFAEKKGWVK